MSDKVRSGKVVESNGTYHLQVGNKTHELTPDMVGGVETLHSLAGQEVEVLYAEPQPVAVLGRHGRITCYLVGPLDVHQSHLEKAAAGVVARLGQEAVRLRPTCYLPAPWAIKGVEDKVRANLAEEMLKQGIISQEIHDKIVGK